MSSSGSSSNSITSSGKAYKIVVKEFFHIEHESTRAIQVPTTGHKVHVWKFDKLHGRIYTKIGVDIDPIHIESGKTQK